MKLLKKSILLSLIAPLLFSLVSFTNAVAGETITIRVYETCTTCGGPTPKIVIIESGKQRTVDLEKMPRNISESNKNLETINSVFEQYHNSGYKIETSNSVVIMNGVMTTYILTK